MKSDVYFVKVGTENREERVLALKNLLEKITPFSEFNKDEIIPVKLTIGDSSCIYNISPELVKLIVREIKKKGAKPFLFDTSVIYKGNRQNALSHLELVEKKGFSYSNVGCPFIIADGIFGEAGKEFKLDSPNIERIKIPSFVGMLENLVVLSHTTGHIISGYASSIKNVAMGMSTRATKQAIHSSLKPYILEEKCSACGCCISICPASSISFKNKKAFINQGLCMGCGECLCACKSDAIFVNWKEDPYIFCKRMVEVASFILLKFKNKFFINFAFDITKECDCISKKGDEMIANNLGILASYDILSLDKACLDLAYKNKRTDFLFNKRDLCEAMLEYAKNLGLGNLEYNLVSVY
ncbi:MAG: DUF362 domain-containing protein [bacterium]